MTVVMDAVSSYMTTSQLATALLDRIAGFSSQSSADMNLAEIKNLEGKLFLAISALRSHRNSQAHVNRLPPEALSIIFGMIQEQIPDFRPAPRNHRMNDWLSVTHVCRDWRNTALSFSSLWTNIDFYRGVSDDAACVFLERSVDAPLKVYYAPHPNLESDPGGDIALKEMDILRKLTSNHMRFQELHILADSAIGDSVWNLFPLACPSIESLTVSMNMLEAPVPLLPSLFSGPTPRLRKLSLRAFSSLGGNNFTNLTHLSLYQQSSTGRHTLTQFLDFLEASPFLEELSLVDAGPQLDTVLPISRQERSLISLTKLRVLEIGRWPLVRTIACFLSHFILPAGIDMRIWGPDFFAREDDLSALFPPFSPQLDPLSGIKQIHISYQSVEPPWQVVAVKDSRLHLHGAFQPHRFLISQNCCQLDQLEEFRVGNSLHDYSEPSKEEWIELFQKMTNLKTLVIFKANPHPVLSAFDPLAESDSDKPLLCTNLEALHIHSLGTVSSFHVSHLAQNRAQKGRPIRFLRMTKEGQQGDEQPYIRRFIEEVECVEDMDINLVIKFPDVWPTAAFSWSA